MTGKKERLKKKIEDKTVRLQMYKDKEAYMLSKSGIRSYGIGSRSTERYNLDLAEIRKAIEELENRAEGIKPRRVVGVIPRDW